MMVAKPAGTESSCPSAAPELGLPLDLILRACSLLPPNEIACNARLLCKASAQHFSSPAHRLVRLGQLVPPAAFAGRYGRGADPGPLRQLSRKLKARLLALTAGSGALENLATLVERMEPPFWWRSSSACPEADAAVAAAGKRAMPAVRLLAERGYPLSARLLVPAVLQHCDLADVEWLLGQAAMRDSPIVRAGKLSLDLVRAAASSAHPNPLAKLSWLRERLGPAMESMLPFAAEAAAGADNLPVLQWALGQVGGSAPPPPMLLLSAAAGSAPRVTRWLLAQPGAVVPDMAVMHAAEGGNTELLRMLLAAALPAQPAGAGAAPDRRRLLTIAFGGAACSGCLDAMQLVAEAAAAHGHADAAALDVDAGCGLTGRRCRSVAAARWLLQRGAWPAQTPADAVLDAVRACSVPMLAFLREEAGADWAEPGPTLQAAVGSEAAGEEVVSALQWLHEQGCPLACEPLVTRKALSRGEPCVLQWLWDRGLLGPAQLADAGLLNAAAGSGCEAAVEWLLAAGCPMGRDGGPYLVAGENGDLDMLRCLRRLGVPWGPDTVLVAVWDEVPMHVVQWMVAEGGAPVGARAVEAAKEGGELREWLRVTVAAGAASGGAR